MMMWCGKEEQFWNNGSSSRNVLVINELQRGLEVVNRLRNLHKNADSLLFSSAEELLNEIISSSETALTMLKLDPPGGGRLMADSEYTDRPVLKKRKMLEKCTKLVRVSLETGFDGTVEDGFNWRKYGQKYIQGANYPRGYYRCTHKQQSGCKATKHVQRSDEDPLIFYISYRGRHTCHTQQEIPPLLTASDDNCSQTCTTSPRQDEQRLKTFIVGPNGPDTPLPPFPNGILLASSSQLNECGSDLASSFTAVSGSVADSMESDNGSLHAFDISSFFCFDT